MVDKVVMYRAEDGTMFKSQQAAADHEKTLVGPFHVLLAEFSNKHPNYLSASAVWPLARYLQEQRGSEDSIGGYTRSGGHDVANAVMEATGMVGVGMSDKCEPASPDTSNRPRGRYVYAPGILECMVDSDTEKMLNEKVKNGITWPPDRLYEVKRILDLWHLVLARDNMDDDMPLKVAIAKYARGFHTDKDFGLIKSAYIDMSRDNNLVPWRRP